MSTTQTSIPVEQLEQQQIFRSVDIDVLEPMLCHCPVRTLNKGDVLIAEGVANRYLYLLLTGRLSVRLESAMAGVYITSLYPGESVGEMSLIQHAPASAFVTAEMASSVLMVDEKTLWAILDRFDVVATNILATLSNRLRYDNDLIYQDRQQLEKQVRILRQSMERFNDFAEVAADWFWEVDANFRCTYLSERYEEVMGVPPERMLGQSFRDFYSEADGCSEKWECHSKDLESHRPFQDFEFEWLHPDGAHRILRNSGKPVFNTDSVFQGYRGAVKDVTEAHRMAQKIAHQATHDPLTGLLNRPAFEQSIQSLLESKCSDGEEHAVCYLDLDQFKVVNDTCGHVAGDELLRQLADLLSRQIRKGDTVARLGGDEFGVLMEYCTTSQARRVADALRQSVQDLRFVWDTKRFNLGVSIGLVPVNEGSGSVAAILSAADNACYAAKDAGRNRIHVYREDDAALARRRGDMQWLARINHALEDDRFHLYCQPIAPITPIAYQGAHYELLIRMEGEDGQMVLPDLFLPAVERYDLATKLDRWVINTIFEWLGRRPERLKNLFLCAINLSGRSLADCDVLDFVISQFDKCRIPPNKICFEVTETAAIANLSNASRFINALKKLGCRFALDDFGSGLSSFAYLKNLPVDFLKIDGVFVKGIADDPIDFAMVKSINEIGHAMGKQTIAEFVENEVILDKLKRAEIGVDYVQGYAIGRPHPVA
jgi:diguanylate cyclase (GGDEF)-like protein/PAS domain S-box-containing protein